MIKSNQTSQPNLSNQFQSPTMSLFESARNSLGRMTRKKQWEGTTVNLFLKPSVVSGVAQVSMVPTKDYIRPGKKLSPTKTEALTQFVDTRLEMTKTDMDARSRCSRRGICCEGMQKQDADYKGSLDTHFRKSGIMVLLIPKSDSELESYCECDIHIITGIGLLVKDIAIRTQLSKDGSTCVSKFLTKTPLESFKSHPDPITFPSLPPKRVEAYNRLLERINNEVQSIVTKYHEGNQHSLTDRKKGDNACESEVWAMMNEKFPRLEHFFSLPNHEDPPISTWGDRATKTYHYRPFNFEAGKHYMPNPRGQNVEPLHYRLDDVGRSIMS